MNKKRLPTVTFIIPHRETETIDTVVECVKRIDYPKEKIEILAVTGNQPSVQRNACIAQAKGEFVYFIDNDSEVGADNLRLAMPLFDDPKVAAVGGPNIAKEGDTVLQRDFSYCLTSPFAIGPLSNRYASRGVPRETTDRELILCNLIIRKSVLDELGAFHSELYPNEENELMDRIIRAGYTMRHHPNVIVRRSPRPTFGSFIRMLIAYGRGRFEQLTFAFHWSNLVFLLPVCFIFYLLGIAPVAFMNSSFWHVAWYFLPLLLYVFILGMGSAVAFSRYTHTRYRALVVVPFVFFLIHFFYGAGLLYGMYLKCVPKKKKDVVYNVTRLKSL